MILRGGVIGVGCGLLGAGFATEVETRWCAMMMLHGGLISSVVQAFRHLLCRGATIALHGNVDGPFGL